MNKRLEIGIQQNIRSLEKRLAEIVHESKTGMRFVIIEAPGFYKVFENGITHATKICDCVCLHHPEKALRIAKKVCDYD